MPDSEITSSSDSAQPALLDELADLERAEAELLARRLRALGALGVAAEQDAVRTGCEQFTVLEVAGSCRIGQRGATDRQLEATHVLDRLPLLLSALEAGELFVPQARVVIRETSSCTDAVCAAVDAAVAARGRELAPGPLRRLVARTIAAAEAQDREAEAERLAQARAARRVWIHPEADGMATISAYVTAEAARAFALGLDTLARQAKAGSDRTMDQCRADVLTELPLRALAESGAVRIVLNVHVPMSTVLDRSNAPGHLDGYGPISAEHVRLLRPHAQLRRVLVDVTTGRPLSVDAECTPATGNDDLADDDLARDRLRAMLRPAVTTDVAERQYRPSAGLARLVRLRDQGCSGPGCSQPAASSDLDHLIPYPQGPTAAWNLGPESRRCHRAKHTGWTVQRHPDGSCTWISPLGRHYHRPPPWDPPPTPGPVSDAPEVRPVIPWWPDAGPLALPPPDPSAPAIEPAASKPDDAATLDPRLEPPPF